MASKTYVRNKEVKKLAIGFTFSFFEMHVHSDRIRRERFAPFSTQRGICIYSTPTRSFLSRSWSSSSTS